MSGRAITQATERAAALRRALTERVVVADGAMGTMLQASDATVADFRGHEGCNEVLNVTRPDIVRAVHDAYFDGGRRLRHDEHVRGQPGEPERVRHPRADRRAVAGRRPAGPRGGGRERGGRRPPALGARLDRPGHETADARPRHLPRAARLLLRERGRAAARRRGRADHRDLPGPAPGEGGDHRGEASGRGARPWRARHRAADHRDDRDHAARQRDRRGADRPRAARHRRDRAELRDRPRRDERAPAVPRRARADPDLLRAERRPAGTDLRRRLLPADPRRARRRARPVRRRVRAVPGRRLLRHDARAHRRARRAPRRRPGAARGPPARQAVARRRAGSGVAVQPRAVPAGHRVPRDRGADQRQRLEGVPRGDDRRQVRGLRGDRPQPDQGRRAPARRVRGLRRPRRRRRHARDRRTAGDRGHAAAGARLHRARRDRGGPRADRRPRRRQLGQLRGRRRARLADRQADAGRQGARRRGGRADHRRAAARRAPRRGRWRSPSG